jgi:hypothetical protein
MLGDRCQNRAQIEGRIDSVQLGRRPAVDLCSRRPARSDKDRSSRVVRVLRSSRWSTPCAPPGPSDSHPHGQSEKPVPKRKILLRASQNGSQGPLPLSEVSKDGLFQPPDRQTSPQFAPQRRKKSHEICRDRRACRANRNCDSQDSDRKIQRFPGVAVSIPTLMPVSAITELPRLLDEVHKGM